MRRRTAAPPHAPPSSRTIPLMLDRFLARLKSLGTRLGFHRDWYLIVLAAGVGAFTAFWGGPGFGGMMGAVLHYSRTEGM